MRCKYRDNKRRALLTQFGLAASLGLTILHAVMSISAAPQPLPGERFTAIELELLIPDFLVTQFTVVAFLFWFRRAYENAAANGMRPRYLLGWSVGAWFMPISNFWRPARIANDMWQHAVATTGAGTMNLVVPWWGTWLLQIAILLPTVWSEQPRGPAVVSALAPVTALGIAFTTAAVVCALLAIAIVRRLTAMQAQGSIDSIASVFSGEGAAIDVTPAAGAGMRRGSRPQSAG